MTILKHFTLKLRLIQKEHRAFCNDIHGEFYSFQRAFTRYLARFSQKPVEVIIALIYFHIADKEIEIEKCCHDSFEVSEVTLRWDIGPPCFRAFALWNFPCVLSFLLQLTNGEIILIFLIGERYLYEVWNERNAA